MLLCSVLGRLAVRSWVLLPLLFLGSAAWVAALLQLALQPHSPMTQDLDLSAPLLFGFAAALTALSSGHVRWSTRWQRNVLRFAYPLLLVACALAVDGLEVPLVAALVAGPVSAALLIITLVRAYQDHAECSHA
ncbi:hypothetical protein [Saccharopolyspora oryzae]|uniref:Uncharacterized protein n=1 Tax=Saccharopolyspora oryzae TaxID=2997343 RepID=A0ABT4V225_9PSEU|nr:hypothetical protein [Saccharopolyspora oryzae]MDA3627998.1 hypothetical protein [Saccharopolyspora oryzae]